MLIAEDNAVRVVDAFVEELDLASIGFEGTMPAATGRHSYDSEGADSWLRENGAVVFKFWATDFPEVSFHSGNNPAIR